jgi:transcription factor 1
VRGLDTLAPGAADDIVPLAPSLRDPKKGGRRNLEQLRVRMLTAEMIEELVVAWENWPFKPSMGELMLKMGVHRFTATDRRL